MRFSTTLLLALLTGAPAWAATSSTQPIQPDARINPYPPLAAHPAPPSQNGLPTQAASSPANLSPQALNADGTPADDAPEAPHYYRWVDEQGHVHFSDRPPEGKTKTVKKEALTPAPETGGGTNITQIYQRASNVMTPPPSAGQHGGNWPPATQPGDASNAPHQPDAPPSSP